VAAFDVTAVTIIKIIKEPPKGHAALR
jgi:hypothetical protein